MVSMKKRMINAYVIFEISRMSKMDLCFQAFSEILASILTTTFYENKFLADSSGQPVYQDFMLNCSKLDKVSETQSKLSQQFLDHLRHTDNITDIQKCAIENMADMKNTTVAEVIKAAVGKEKPLDKLTYVEAAAAIKHVNSLKTPKK